VPVDPVDPVEMLPHHLLQQHPNLGLLVGVAQAFLQAPMHLLNKTCCCCFYRAYTQQNSPVAELTSLQTKDHATLSLLVRGRRASNPPLLVVHGGPGASSFPSRLTSAFSRLEQHFTVVYYDQRSALKSGYQNIQRQNNHTPHTKSMFLNSLTIPQHVTDLICVAEHICHQFNVDQIHLLGGSWGTILVQLAARDRPELFKSITLRGVVVDTPKSEQLSTRYVLTQQRMLGAKHYSEEDIGKHQRRFTSPLRRRHTFAKLLEQRTQLAAVGGVAYRTAQKVKQDKVPGYEWTSKALLMKNALLCEELTLKEIYYGVFNGHLTLKALWPSLKNYVSLHHVKELKVSTVLVLQGRHDYCTCSSLVAKWFDTLKVVGGDEDGGGGDGKKKLVWFENSGHAPHIEEPDKFVQCMVTHVLLNE
jgi:proline iminopeptidase